jgi:Flp pilus assembly protein TadB
MQGIRTFFIAASSLAILAMVALFTASLTVAFVGILAVLTAGRLLSAKLKPTPIRVKRNEREDMRVWNDGKGTIIDL